MTKLLKLPITDACYLGKENLSSSVTQAINHQKRKNKIIVFEHEVVIYEPENQDDPIKIELYYNGDSTNEAIKLQREKTPEGYNAPQLYSAWLKENGRPNQVSETNANTGELTGKTTTIWVKPQSEISTPPKSRKASFFNFDNPHLCIEIMVNIQTAVVKEYWNDSREQNTNDYKTSLGVFFGYSKHQKSAAVRAIKSGNPYFINEHLWCLCDGELGKKILNIYNQIAHKYNQPETTKTSIALEIFMRCCELNPLDHQAIGTECERLLMNYTRLVTAPHLATPPKFNRNR